MNNWMVDFIEDERVFTFGFDFERHIGTLKKNTDNSGAEWCLYYDSGEIAPVLDKNTIYKLEG